MPEIKQNFIRGKMNKDLDERLIQKGEYREAQNVHIVESSGADVGAIENARGNIKVSGGTSYLTGTGYETVGYCKDIKNKRVIYFVTNYSSNTFTDNIRSIDYAKGAGTAFYNDSQAPDGDNRDENCAIILYDIKNKITYNLVVGAWLNFSKKHLITGAQVIDDLLFFTDNRNQPRKINIKTALDNFVSDTNQYYTCEEQISVAKYAPYKSIMLHNGNGTFSGSNDGSVTSEYMQEKFIRFSYRYKYSDGEYSLIAPFTQAIFEPLNSSVITDSDNGVNSTSGELAVPTSKKDVYKKTTVDIMQNRINEVDLYIPVPNKDEFITTDYSASAEYSNPYNIEEIDIILKESDGISFKIVKTISINNLTSNDVSSYNITPSSIDNGLILNKILATRTSDYSEEASGYTNGTFTVSSSDLQTDGSGTGASVSLVMAEEEPRTLTVLLSGSGYAVGDRITIPTSVIGGTGPVSYTIKQEDLTGNTYYRQIIKYTYKSQEPYKVLPESEVTRVYDQVPLLAKALDVTGNRVVFGNYVENYQYPTDTNGKKGINYIIASTTKGNIDQANTNNGLVQYLNTVQKYHSVKQRRTYQVGIVFSDAFGRQSPVVLSSSNLDDSDTHTVPAEINDYSSNASGSWSSSRLTFGKSLKIAFQDRFLSGDNNFSGDLRYGKNYNPHGWYSYRIVIKQTQQDYYNVYCSHPFDGWNNIDKEPDTGVSTGRSWLSLYGSNINKVPRSINDNDLNRDGIASSDSRLYPKIVFSAGGGSILNTQNDFLIDVVSLGTATEQSLYVSGDENKSAVGGFSVYNFIYGKDKNPIVAELPNMRQYHAGSPPTSNNKAEMLSVDTDQASGGSTSLALSSDASDTDDFYNGYSINAVGIKTDKDSKNVTIVDYDGGNETATLSSKQELKAGDFILLSDYKEGLSVFETEPFESKLDIYYETSTSGLVADLEEQIFVDEANQMTNPTLEQAGISLNEDGLTQPSLQSGTAFYNKKIFVYENQSNDKIIGNFGVTNNQGDFEVDIVTIKRKSSGELMSSIFAISEPTNNNFRLKTVGNNYVFTNSDDSVFVIRTSFSDGTSIIYEDFEVEVKNSKPTVTAPSTVNLTRTAGANANVINTNNQVDNGSNKISGAVNQNSNLDVNFNFGDTSFNNYFTISVGNGVYTLTTSSAWTTSNADTFFAASNSDRTVTITASETYNGTTTTNFATCRIDEGEVAVAGKMWSVDTLDTRERCDVNVGDAATYYVIANGASEPVVKDGFVVPNVNNIVYTDSSLSTLAPYGIYITVNSLIDDEYFHVRINGSGANDGVVDFKSVIFVEDCRE